MNNDIQTYNQSLDISVQEICSCLSSTISRVLPEANSRMWHKHPVWFLNGNPIVGYKKTKRGVHLLFWSGQSFEEENLQNEGCFKAASIEYTSPEQLDLDDLERWLLKSRVIQWDYKNIVKNKGILERVKFSIEEDT